jgi:hypothetical protein
LVEVSTTVSLEIVEGMPETAREIDTVIEGDPWTIRNPVSGRV